MYWFLHKIVRNNAQKSEAFKHLMRNAMWNHHQNHHWSCCCILSEKTESAEWNVQTWSFLNHMYCISPFRNYVVLKVCMQHAVLVAFTMQHAVIQILCFQYLKPSVSSSMCIDGIIGEDYRAGDDIQGPSWLSLPPSSFVTNLFWCYGMTTMIMIMEWQQWSCNNME